MATSAAKAWIPRAAAATEVQWQHFLGLCGTWRGSWQRYAADADSQALKPIRHFQAFCVPCAAEDGQSVHHVNRYPPSAAPPGGRRMASGLTEVDFGRFDPKSFLAPFGPQSQAVYGPGWAAIGPRALQGSERVAVELVSMAQGSDQRRRLVGIWRQAEAVATLEAATLITEELQRTGSEGECPLIGDTAQEKEAEKPAIHPDAEGWYQLGPDAFALLPQTVALDHEAMAVGLSWLAPGGVNGLLLDFPEGQLRVRSPP
ncbi:unnamed protein product [Symbiodinium natans]|uniref:DUF3598 domain-containing protein n=1 Tax=Symbiodinium natans TaxID=878477 RepID=A0A812NL87_9DINO|nr:unnamed protein product [Symbiodinium natans]